MLKWAQLFAIWYYLYTFKKVKNAHGGVLPLVKLMPVTLPKVKFLHECLSRFVNCVNVTKSSTTSQLVHIMKKLM